MASMYTININKRMYTLFYVLSVISVLSIIGAIVLHEKLLIRPSLITPASLMFFAGVFWLYDRVLWRLPVIRILSNGIPYIAGVWEGRLSRVVDGKDVEIQATLTITQTWSLMGLSLVTPEAISSNTVASLQLADPEAIVVTWIYLKHGSDARSLSESGKGVVELTLNRQTKEISLRGPFYESEPKDYLMLLKSK